MKKYEYSTSGKIKGIGISVLLHCFYIFVSFVVLINFPSMKFVLIFLVGWIVFRIFSDVTGYGFTKFYLNDEGILIIDDVLKIKKYISWNDIQKIEVNDKNGRPGAISVFFEKGKNKIVFNNFFENYEELIGSILSNVEKAKESRG